MSEQVTQGEAREFLDLEVREVSMVDRPANLREFLILKRLQEVESMTAFQTDYSSVHPSEIGLEVPQSAVPAEFTADLAAVAEAVEKAAGCKTDEEITKALAPDLKAAISRVMGFLGKLVKGDYPAPMKKTETKKAADGAATEPAPPPASAPATEPAPPPASAPATEPAPPPAAATEPVTKAAVAVMADGAVHVEGVRVEKARGFTAARTNTVKAAAMALLKLLKDVDGETLKSVLGEINKTEELPTQANVGSEVRPDVPAQVAKNAEPAPSSGGSELVGKLDEIAKRLDVIETARQPSTSVEPAGTTAKAEPTRKSFWQGIL